MNVPHTSLTFNTSLTSSFAVMSPNTTLATNSQQALFPSDAESTYITLLTIFSALAVPAHLLAMYMAVFQTPSEMFNYRLTMTNTSFWSLLAVIQAGLLLHPVPYFPLPVVKIAGPLAKLGASYGGNLQLYLLIFLHTNFITAAVICFLVICLFLLGNPFAALRLKRKAGVAIAVGVHLLMSGAVMTFMLCGYRPLAANTAKELIDAGWADKIPGLGTSADSAVFIGYPLDPFDPDGVYLSLLVHCIFVSIVISVLILFSLLIKRIWRTINKGCPAATSRQRRAVVFMLSARVLIPLVFYFFPVLALSMSLHLGVSLGFGVNCLLLACIITHGLLNTLMTVAVFGPYRNGLLRAIRCVLPTRVANRVGLMPVMGGSTWHQRSHRAESGADSGGGGSSTSHGHTQCPHPHQSRITDRWMDSVQRVSIHSAEPAAATAIPTGLLPYDQQPGRLPPMHANPAFDERELRE